MIEFYQSPAPFERIEVWGRVDINRYISIEKEELQKHPELRDHIKKKLTMDLKDDMLRYIFHEDGIEDIVRGDPDVKELLLEGLFKLRYDYETRLNPKSKRKDYNKVQAAGKVIDYVLKIKDKR